MAVKVRIKGNPETTEFKDAQHLRAIFLEGLTDNRISGEILIIPNATLFGQKVKDVDLVVIGKLDGYAEYLETESLTPPKFGGNLPRKSRQVYVHNFCFVIECKQHPISRIELDGITLKVKYNNKRSDVTTQSENQKYSLRKFFDDRLRISPYICNFIWLRGVNWDSIKQLLSSNKEIYNKHNYLPANFSVNFLFTLACTQNPPYTHENKSTKVLKQSAHFTAVRNHEFHDLNELEEIFNIFEKVKIASGGLTRKKIARITNKLLDNQQYAQAIGEKLVIISGRAGTGKTIKLLSIACDLAIQQSARCLILTYNHALVSDIKRTLALAELPDSDDVDSYSVNITTLHKFFYEIVVGFDIGEKAKLSKTNKKYLSNFISEYKTHLNTLKEYLDLSLIGDKEITDLMTTRHQEVGWDYVLIDESQDWKEIEKDIIFRLFGREKVIIADGVDQLIRSQQKCNWTEKLKNNTDFKKTFEKKGLRQKVNLVNFVNSLADELNINWNLEAKQELIGGKVIISTGYYKENLHQSLYEECKKGGNTAYEMMFLVPPSLVQKNKVKNRFGELKTVRKFKHIKYLEELNINVWDGTNTDLRTEYPVDLNQHRLLQYESCRGLEGWTVINLNFDEFIESKIAIFEEEETLELALESLEEKRYKFVYLWALIPMTRAIDTLVITLKNPDSHIGQCLRKVYEKNKDFVDWM